MIAIIWLDTETTGLSPDKHGIIEAGIIIDIDGIVKNRTRVQMKPTGRVADDSALNINGFTRDQIRNLEPWENIYIPLMDHIKSAAIGAKFEGQFILAGQNVQFDNRFMVSWEKFCGIESENNWSKLVNQDPDSFIDTKKMFDELKSRGFVDRSISSKLGSICDYFEVDLKNAHSAMGDISATREVYYKMREML